MSTDATQNFFERRDAHNRLKSDIVVSFFKAYAWIFLGNANRVRYVDLFAGRGYYDGCNELQTDEPVHATALMILKAIIAEPKFRTSVAAWFNEGDPVLYAELAAAAQALPGFDTIVHKPRFSNLDVSTPDFSDEVDKIADCPIFAFVDPFGYKGLTRKLIASLIEGWGCDVAFFFNYRRFSMGVGHHLFDVHFEKIIGEERLQRLQADVVGLDPEQREELVVLSLRESLRELKAKHILTFRFRVADGRTSHHLVFASKHERGYRVMRDKMIQYSKKDESDIAFFEYVADNPDKPTLFDTPVIMPPRKWPYSAKHLAEAIYSAYKGDARPVTFKALFEQWELREDLPYAKTHYRQALLILAESKRLNINVGSGKPSRKGSIPETATLRFT